MSSAPLDIRCVRIRLKKGSLPAVKEWQSFLKAHHDDVQQTLKAENVVLEAAFLDKSGADDYLIYIMACPDFEHAHRTAKKSESIVDIFHRKFKQDWWEDSEELEALICFHDEKNCKKKQSKIRP